MSQILPNNIQTLLPQKNLVAAGAGADASSSQRLIKPGMTTIEGINPLYQKWDFIQMKDTKTAGQFRCLT